MPSELARTHHRGAQFKLGGYTLMKPVTEGERPLVSFAKDGNAPLIPLAAFVQASATRTANTKTAGTDDTTFPRNDEAVLQQLSVFVAGRVSDHVGGFAQWTFDGVAHHSSIDNTDLRLAGRYNGDVLDVSYGLSLNNNPTMSDIYNTTPVWGFPFASSGVAATPAAATLIEGGLAQQVAGLSGCHVRPRRLGEPERQTEHLRVEGHVLLPDPVRCEPGLPARSRRHRCRAVQHWRGRGRQCQRKPQLVGRDPGAELAAPARPALHAAIHRLPEVQRGLDELRRLRPQCSGQQHSLCRGVVSFLKSKRLGCRQRQGRVCDDE